MNQNNPNAVRTELESLERVRARLNDPASTWHDVVIQGVNLRPLDEALGKAAIAGCHFLGCDIGRNLADAIAKANARPDSQRLCLVFPKMPWLPFDPYRGSLYQPEELLGRFESEDPIKEKATYEASVDWQCYLTYVDPVDARSCTDDSLRARLLESAGDAGWCRRQAQAGVSMGPETGGGKRIHAPADRDRFTARNRQYDHRLQTLRDARRLLLRPCSC
jgi:hypothetical protein